MASRMIERCWRNIFADEISVDIAGFAAPHPIK